MKPKTIWIFFFSALFLTLAWKALTENWFAAREPLPLNGQPALVFFTLSKGCECQMTIVRAAEAQLAGWDSPLPLLRVDFDRRPDLAEQFRVSRAPALALLNAEGKVIWKQDEGINDAAPLNMLAAEIQIKMLR